MKVGFWTISVPEPLTAPIINRAGSQLKIVSYPWFQVTDLTYFLDSVTRDWWCTDVFLVFPFFMEMALKWFWTQAVRQGAHSSSPRTGAADRQS